MVRDIFWCNCTGIIICKKILALSNVDVVFLLKKCFDISNLTLLIWLMYSYISHFQYMLTNILKRIVPSQVITLNSKTFGDIGFQLEDRLFSSGSLEYLLEIHGLGWRFKSKVLHCTPISLLQHWPCKSLIVLSNLSRCRHRLHIKRPLRCVFVYVPCVFVCVNGWGIYRWAL